MYFVYMYFFQKTKLSLEKGTLELSMTLAKIGYHNETLCTEENKVKLIFCNKKLKSFLRYFSLEMLYHISILYSPVLGGEKLLDKLS